MTDILKDAAALLCLLATWALLFIGGAMVTP